MAKKITRAINRYKSIKRLQL